MRINRKVPNLPIISFNLIVFCLLIFLALPPFLNEQISAGYYFYDPINLEEGQIHFEKYNNTQFPNNVFHSDMIHLSIGIKNINGHPLPNKSLTLTVHSVFYGPEIFLTKTKVLVQESEEKLVTDAHGVASIDLIYNQDDWPINFGTAYFEITSSYLINKTATSNIITFNYLKKKISRQTNDTNGLEILSLIENMNLIEIVSNDSSIDNEFLNWSTNFYTKSRLELTIINTSTIVSFNDQIQYSTYNYFLEFTYEATSISFKKENLSLTLLNELYSEYMTTGLNQDIFSSQYWLTSGDLGNLSFNQGWIIFQEISFDRIHDMMNGDFIGTEQIAILTSNGHILWLASNGGWAIS